MENLGILYIFEKLKIGFIAFGGFAIFGGAAKVILEHNKEDGYKVLFKALLKFAFIAAPLGVLFAGLVFHKYGDIFLASIVAVLIGAMSPNIILWTSRNGMNEIVKRFTNDKK